MRDRSARTGGSPAEGRQERFGIADVVLLREAKVDQDWPVFTAQKYVGRLDVVVRDPVLVKVGDRRKELDQVRARVRLGERDGHETAVKVHDAESVGGRKDEGVEPDQVRVRVVGESSNASATEASKIWAPATRFGAPLVRGEQQRT